MLKLGVLSDISERPDADSADSTISCLNRVLKARDLLTLLHCERVGHLAYRRGASHEEAFGVITIGDGRTSPSNFDPEVLKAFLRNSTRIEEMYEGVSLKLGEQ